MKNTQIRKQVFLRDWRNFFSADELRAVSAHLDILIEAERERCAYVAAVLDVEKAPADYKITAPGLEGLCEDWERQACYHGDRIAERIRATQ